MCGTGDPSPTINRNYIKQTDRPFRRSLFILIPNKIKENIR